MKILKFVTFGIVFGFMAASCNNSGNDNPKSVPTDSTNINGTAPAQYGPDSATNNPNGSVNSSADTGVRVNNGRVEDTMSNSLPVH